MSGCTVWQCDVVWCSVVQCGAVWCSVVQCGAVWCSVVQCCRVVQCGAVWCSVVQCGAICCSRRAVYGSRSASYVHCNAVIVRVRAVQCYVYVILW